MADLVTTEQSTTLAALIGAVEASNEDLAQKLQALQSTADGAPMASTTSAGLPGTKVSGPGYDPAPAEPPALAKWAPLILGLGVMWLIAKG